MCSPLAVSHGTKHKNYFIPQSVDGVHFAAPVDVRVCLQLVVNLVRMLHVIV